MSDKKNDLQAYRLGCMLYFIAMHANQYDLKGEPYFKHILRVGLKGQNWIEEIVGFGHDCLEDTNATVEELQGLINETEFELTGKNVIVDAIIALTHKKGEELEDYWDRVKANPIALIVKKYDIDDNSDPSRRLVDLPEVQKKLDNKYAYARFYLFGIKPAQENKEDIPS